jgi:competence protein ComEA
VGERPGIQIAAWGVAAALVLLAGLKLLRPGGPGSGAAPPVRIDDGGPETGRSDGRSVYVHVAGAVRRPGLYRVPASARVAAALDRAGGPDRRAELAAVNLAARVEDGQQIVVPRAGAAAALGTEAAATSGAKISLATATPDQLDTLDGIGPTLAKRILEYRDSHGGIRSLEELREVEGIGDKRFEALKQGLQP